MPKRSGRKLKGGALADSLPNMSNSPKQPNVPQQPNVPKQPNVPQQMKPPAMPPKSLANSPQMNISSPPKPASPDNLSNKTSIPGAGLAEKSLQTAEEGISFFEEYGYQIAIGGIVLLIVGILAYYFVFRDNTKKDSSTTGSTSSTTGTEGSTTETAGSTTETAGSTAGSAGSTAGSAGSTTAGSSGSTTTGSSGSTTTGSSGSTTTGSSGSTTAGSTAGTAGSSGTTSSTTNTNSNTEGFTTEILDTIVNGDTVNKEEDKEFPAGRPDLWIPEKNPLLPGRNI